MKTSAILQPTKIRVFFAYTRLSFLPLITILLSEVFSHNAFAQTTVTLTTGTSWTVPAGVCSVTIEAWGGGGAGAAATSVGGGGGGTGAYVKGTFPVTAGAAIPYTIGAGGTSSGGNGGTTSILGATAGGGGGGTTTTGGTGGTASGGSTNTNGNSGSNASAGTGGNGGTAPNGGAGGTAYPSLSNNGNPGIAPGGGGKGGKSSNGTGGAGGAGQIKITYVIPTSIPVNSGTSCATTASGNFTATTAAFPIGGASAMSSCTTVNNGDLWFSFTASSDAHTITLAGGIVAFPAVTLTLYQGNVCTGTLSEVAGSCGNTNFIRATGLTPGTTYYVRVTRDNNTTTGSFTMCVTTPSGSCALETVNYDFEQPVIPTNSGPQVHENNVPGWRTTAPDGMIEFWSNNFGGGGTAVPSFSGNQFVELNANTSAGLYQDFETSCPVVFKWRFYHRQRQTTTETAALKAGAPGSLTEIFATNASSMTGWTMYEGYYTVPAGQTITRFQFETKTPVGSSIGNFLDAISFNALNEIITPGPVTMTCGQVQTVLEATGIGGTWSRVSAPTGASTNTITTSVAGSGNTLATVSGFSVPGNYVFRWSTCLNNCQSEITVYYPGPVQTITAGTNATLCQGANITPAITMTISGASGATGSGLPAGVTATTSGTTVTISGTPTATGTFNYTVTTTAAATTTTCPAASTSGTITVTANTTPTFAPLANVCVGATAPTLPTTSTNGITGAWNASPSTATAGTFSFTFTPTSGTCVTTAGISLTVVANTTPTFAPLANVCIGATAPTLPTTSTNGFTGTWNASPSTATAGTFSFTFTPTSGTCVTTASISLTVVANTTPTFPALANVCVGASAPTLPTSSNEGITGSWNASPSTASAGTFTFTFTPTSGTCVTTASISLTVVANTTPTFPALANVCVGATAPTLPTSSNEGITGSWNASPSTASAGTFTFTFAPTSGTCVTTTSISLTVTNNLTPTFTPLTSVCVGDPAPTLPTTSNDSPPVGGTWNAAPSTAAAGTFTFTFTPSSGTCVTTTTITFTVTGNVTPTFAPLANVCVGAPAPTLPTSSIEGITGSWNTAPSTASAGTFTYTFTPSSGTCQATTTLTLTVDPAITPTFPAIASVCVGASAPALPASSNEGITGSWNASPSTAAAGTFTFTFTPTSGTCVTTASISLTVTANTVPVFTPLSSVCVGDPAPVLPTSSNDSPPITGSWNAAPSTATVGTFTFTFTPSSGTCVTTTTITFTVTGNVIPTFTPLANVCEDSSPAPTLPSSSIEGVTGAWNTAPNTATPGTFTFTFTPSAGACQSTTTITLTVDPAVTPTFNALPTVCQGDPAPTLPTVSTNSPSITGTWNAATSTASAGTFTYTFTPDNGQCATTATLSLTVTAGVTPTFDALTAVCVGEPAPALPTSSTNSPPITGTWSSAPSTSSAGTFSFTFTPGPGQCATTATISFTVNGNPVIDVPSLSTCSGIPVTMNASGASSYVWTPNTGLDHDDQPSATATLTANQTYTITGTDANGCTGVTTATVTISSNLTILVSPANPTICAGGSVVLNATGGTNYTWTGTGVTPNNTATVTASPSTTTTYTVNGNTSGCTGTTTVTVIVGPPVTPTFAAIGPLCSGSTAPTLPTSSTNSPAITGTWNAPTASTASAGSTTYTFTPAASECATTTTMSVTVNAAPTVAGVIETCNATNTQYTVQVTLSGGNPATYSMTGGPGSFSGNVWTSTPITSGTPYNFNFDDGSGCGPVNVAGVKNCNCSTSAGTMSGPALTLCQADVANAVHNGNEVLDGNDALGFVLHSGSGTTLGTVYATSSTPSFSYTGTLTFGTTYYISAIAGDDNGSGGVTTTDPCLSVAAGTSVVWYATPVSTPANNGPLCEGQTLNLTANTVAGGNYTWTGPNSYGIQNPTKPNVTLADAGTYTLVITANGCPSAAATTTLVVNAQTVPTFAAMTSVCQGAANPSLPLPNEGIPGTWNSAPSTASAGMQTFTFTPSAGQCATTSSLSFTVNPLPVANAGTDQAVCPNTAVNICGTGAGTGGSYNWTGGVINCTTFTPGSTQTYILTVTDVNGCQGTDNTTVTVLNAPAVTANSNPMTACDGESITLTGGGALTYAWNPTATNGVAFVPAPGTVTYTVTGTDANNCQGTSTVTVTIYALPTVNGGPDQTVCPGEEITLAGGGAVTYSWDGAVDNTPFVPTDYTYTVSGTDGNGCQNTDQVIVTIATPPVADFSVNQTETTVSEPMFIFTNQSTGGATYAWDFGDETTSTEVDPTHTYPTTPATYSVWLYVTSTDGCQDSTRQTVLVKDELVFWVPNTFTPDGDAYNNTFQPVFTSGYDPYDFSLYVFNRWGEIVFESHDAKAGWDGTYQGKLVPEGTYTWTIEVKNPQDDERSRHQGHVLMIR